MFGSRKTIGATIIPDTAPSADTTCCQNSATPLRRRLRCRRQDARALPVRPPEMTSRTACVYPPPPSVPEVGTADRFVGAQLVGGAPQRDAPRFQHVPRRGGLRRGRPVF